MKKKIISLILVCLCTFGIGCPVHAEEEYDNEWDYTEEYTENEYYDEYYYNENDEYYYNENDDYSEESYDGNTEYYEESQELTQESYTEENYTEEPTEETSVTEEIAVTEEISVIQESVVSEISLESSEEKSVASEIGTKESSIDEIMEEPEMTGISEPKILNLAFTAPKEEQQTNRMSGTDLWCIMFVLTVFSIIFLPKTGGIELIKDRYRYRKAKKITKRHIR